MRPETAAALYDMSMAAERIADVAVVAGMKRSASLRAFQTEGHRLIPVGFGSVRVFLEPVSSAGTIPLPRPPRRTSS